MTLPMSLMPLAPDSATAACDLFLDLGFAQLLRQVGGQHAELEFLGLDEVGARRLFVLRDRLAALLDHLLEDRDHVGVAELDALVDFLLLDRREDEADGRQARRILGAHRRLHVFADLLLKGGWFF